MTDGNFSNENVIGFKYKSFTKIKTNVSLFSIKIHFLNACKKLSSYYLNYLTINLRLKSSHIVRKIHNSVNAIKTT